MVLQRSDDVRAEALEIFGAQRVRIRALGIPGELVLVGGTSVVGALTKGDVDLHLRVPLTTFESAVAVLERTMPVVHREIWCSTLATFEVPAALPTGLAVTPTGSEHDLRFTRVWQLLAADAALVAEYNAVKLAAGGPAAIEYDDRKSAFFDRLVELWPQHPAGGLTSR